MEGGCCISPTIIKFHNNICLLIGLTTFGTFIGLFTLIGWFIMLSVRNVSTTNCTEGEIWVSSFVMLYVHQFIVQIVLYLYIPNYFQILSSYFDCLL